MEPSAEPRFRKRIPCRLQHGESSYAGVLLNFSRTGLFVQTSAAPARGDTVELKLTGGILLQAETVWQRRVPPQLRSVSEGGVGLRIRNAPEGYYSLLAQAAGVTPVTRVVSEKPSGAATEASGGDHLYRARIRRVDGPRSRTLEIRADSVAQARSRALAQAGDGWAIAEIERGR